MLNYVLTELYSFQFGQVTAKASLEVYGSLYSPHCKQTETWLALLNWVLELEIVVSGHQLQQQNQIFLDWKNKTSLCAAQYKFHVLGTGYILIIK